jgi:hypothetical protein
MPRAPLCPPLPGSPPEVMQRYDEMRARRDREIDVEFKCVMGFSFLLIAAMVIFAVYVWQAWPDFSHIERQMAKYNAFMRECVPTEWADRCNELWHYTKKDQP